MSYERRIVLTALASLAPVAVAALLLAWLGDFSSQVRWTVLFVIAVGLFVATWVLHDRLVYPLRTISNLITALREEDYSLRAHQPRREDALGDILAEVNALAHLMQSRKLQSVEAAALLRSVMSQIDVAIFAFGPDNHLQLVNAAGEALLAAPGVRLVGRSADDLGLADLLTDAATSTVDRTFPGRSGRWNVARSSFRERGVPHRLLLVSDITRALREEEAEAWRRIVRVLGHELNNSLAPIMSIASSLEQVISKEELPVDWRDDLSRGMRVIGARTEALTRFTRAYARLARLPEPRRSAVLMRDLSARVTAMETRTTITIDGPDLIVHADEDQLEQLLINLLRNAVDSSLENGQGAVTLRWRHTAADLILEVEDDGDGVSGTENLFVPFFTTKPQGNGIGLFLSRQIAEAHGGSLTLENRSGRAGAIARLTLPLDDERTVGR
ncbi:MAG TPA: ATP-binding protein [Thermoanaerobaculia bacterium]